MPTCNAPDISHSAASTNRYGLRNRILYIMWGVSGSIAVPSIGPIR
jgi:hypothetical protein